MIKIQHADEFSKDDIWREAKANWDNLSEQEKDAWRKKYAPMQERWQAETDAMTDE